jgi:hypothetical protein
MLRHLISLVIILSLLFTGLIGQSADLALLQLHFDSIKRERVLTALINAYGGMIEKIEKRGEETVLTIGGEEIYYKNGKMLSFENLDRHEDFEPIFYRYPLGPLTSLPAPVDFPENRSSDFLDALIGSTEHEIRASCQWVGFLGHRAYMHKICVSPLKKVEARIYEHAEKSKDVRLFLSQLSVLYSMKRRNIAGSNRLSYHAYGLAVDIIPKSYKGKDVYWRWSKPLETDWGSIPYSERWHPPEEVIQAFEENGFVWGGKWYHFDTVHFEYRPEIIYLNKSN